MIYIRQNPDNSRTMSVYESVSFFKQIKIEKKKEIDFFRKCGYKKKKINDTMKKEELLI